MTRRVESSEPEAIVLELEAGPSEVEASLGLRSALSEADAVGGLEVEGTTAAVDLTESFTELSGSEQRIALAQLVLSLTGGTGIEQLAITVEGEPVEIPRSDGTLTRDPVGPEDYVSIAAP